jgi:uncharacterized membrane protein YqjE
VTTTPGSQAPRPATGEPASIGDLLSDITRDLSTLMRQEVELAKAELRQSAKQSGRGAGILGAAGIFAHFAVLFLLIAIWWGIGNATGRGWAGLIVMVITAVIAAVLGVLGRKQIQATPGLPKTTDSVKRIPDAVKGNEGNVNVR